MSAFWEEKDRADKLEDLYSEAQREIRRLKAEAAFLNQTVGRQNRLLSMLHDQAEAKGWDVEHDWEVSDG
jgi:hypothetical protein|tara:strand:- start:160 stop:369 length:210 start_codon:yes stop_codon:yes gene_type:complete